MRQESYSLGAETRWNACTWIGPVHQGWPTKLLYNDKPIFLSCQKNIALFDMYSLKILVYTLHQWKSQRWLTQRRILNSNGKRTITFIPWQRRLMGSHLGFGEWQVKVYKIKLKAATFATFFFTKVGAFWVPIRHLIQNKLDSFFSPMQSKWGNFLPSAKIKKLTFNFFLFTKISIL